MTFQLQHLKLKVKNMLDKMVEYLLGEKAQQIFASKYQLHPTIEALLKSSVIEKFVLLSYVLLT